MVLEHIVCWIIFWNLFLSCTYIGDWIHNLEIRVGNSSVWTEMTTCGTYPGPSETGAIITIECRPSRYGRYVTLKIVLLNYHITDDSNANNGNNVLILEEVVVNGLNLWSNCGTLIFSYIHWISFISMYVVKSTIVFSFNDTLYMS